MTRWVTPRNFGERNMIYVEQFLISLHASFSLTKRNENHEVDTLSYNNLDNRYGVSVSQMTTDMFRLSL